MSIRIWAHSYVNLYTKVLNHEMSAQDLYEQIRPNQVQKFRMLHSAVRRSYERQASLPSEVSRRLKDELRDPATLLAAIVRAEEIVVDLAHHVRRQAELRGEKIPPDFPDH